MDTREQIRKTVCYIISNINKALAFEWIAEGLDKDQFELHFILLNPGGSVLEDFIKQRNISVLRIHYSGKKDLLKAILKIRHYLKENKIQTVHCHLFDANLAGLLAAKTAGIRKRIFTRHHATFHHQYFPGAVYYDRFINFLATDIVAISENVKNVLIEKEQVTPEKITLIHHGFPLEKFQEASEEKIQKLKRKYHTENKYPVIGVISRYVDWKGIQYIIPAFAEILRKYPQAHLILANSSGNYKIEIQGLIKNIPQESYTEILFEEDLFSLYHLFDIFVHVPVNAEIEAFGQTYIEALAAGVPSVFTLSGVAKEFIEHEKNALVVPFKNTESIKENLYRLLDDKLLTQSLIETGKVDIKRLFELDTMIEKLNRLYATPS
jgi:glycosyltransferase involved in cell wall biosynthesis